MTHVTLRSEFETLIDPYAPVGQVGTGFDFTEGPIWHPLDHYLLFSDMPGDVRRRWDARRGVVEVKRPANKCNGMTYDAELNLIVCEHATSSLIRERPDGRRDKMRECDREMRSLAALSPVENRHARSPGAPGRRPETALRALKVPPPHSPARQRQVVPVLGANVTVA